MIQIFMELLKDNVKSLLRKPQVKYYSSIITYEKSRTEESRPGTSHRPVPWTTIVQGKVTGKIQGKSEFQGAPPPLSEWGCPFHTHLHGKYFSGRLNFKLN